MSLNQIIPGEFRPVVPKEFNTREITHAGKYVLAFGSELYIARTAQGWGFFTEAPDGRKASLIVSHEGADLIAAAVLDTRDPDRELPKPELTPFK